MPKTDKLVVDLIKEESDKYEGTFTASVDGVQFMYAQNLLFHTAQRDYFIIGSSYDIADSVAFCVKRDLEGDGPHEVEWYKEGGLNWSVSIAGVFHVIKQGNANVEFLKRDGDRYGVSGTIDFVLPVLPERKVTGKFQIKRI